MEKRKKTILLLMSYIATFNIYQSIKKMNLDLNGNDDYIPYGSYSLGNIYIVPEGEESYIKCNPNDIIVLDKRFEDNPDIAICNSYKITDTNLMSEILDVVLDYENEFPSSWDRDKHTMIVEWVCHNICFGANIHIDRTAHVDFDNEDGKIYKKFVK